MSSTVHLVNPSHVSFGVAVITPRWLYVLAAATGTEWGDPHHRRRDARAHRHRPRSPQATSSASASTPATRCAATKSAAWRASAARGSSSAAFTRRSFPTKPHEHGARPRGRQGRRRSGLVVGRRRLLRRHSRSAHLRRRPRRRRTVPVGALGSAAAEAATCGRRCRRCAAARSTARSARCGAPTARSRGSAASIAWSREIVELRRLGFRFIALADDNFYPVTLRRSRDGAPPRRSRRGCTSSRRCAQERFELMAQLARAARRPGVLHADHDGSGRGYRVPRRDAKRATSAARWSASSR